jgi:heat shock protein HslJ
VTVAPAETFVAGSTGTLVTGAFNDTQTFEVQVPGQVVTDLVGERVEDVQLHRGTGQLWFQADGAVQARWFTGSQEACESFTVTVRGGSEDANRHAAVDLAERVLMPSELGSSTADDDLAAQLEGEWLLERSTVDGAPTDGRGLRFSFLDGDASWTDGCNSFGGPYTAESGSTLVVGDIGSTDLPCPTNPTSQAVLAVMGAGRIDVAFDDELLTLGAGSVELVLRPA